MAKFIGVNTLGYDLIQSMFDIELNAVRHVTSIETKLASERKDIIWIRSYKDLTQALTLHSIGLSNKEIQLSLYDTPPLIPQ